MSMLLMFLWHPSTQYIGMCFYVSLLKQHVSGEMIDHKDLISRVNLTQSFAKYGISLLRYIFNDFYS